MILGQLKSQNIKNVVIFVCDSLRWDYIPVSVLEMGLSIKTVSSSLYTASSFPSFFSGLYPPKTGVHTWEDVLPRSIRGIFDFDGYNPSLWCETTWTDLPPNKSEIHRILGNPKGISLENIQPPFIYVEDDKGGHCPYGFPSGEYMGGGCPEFFKEYGKKGREELIIQYKKGVKQSVEYFKKRIKTLEDRGLTQSTLIIFTSDHGELLGEYGGLTYHNRPPCPELVYVPTVFIHPSIKTKIINDAIIRHVDFYPTIASIINKKISYKVDGVDLTSESLPSTGLSFRYGGYFKSKNKIENWMTYQASSIWDYHGGHIFHGLGYFRALLFFFFKLFIQKHPRFNFMRENLKKNPSNKYREYWKALKHFSIPYMKYLDPNFTKSAAKEYIDNYLNESLEFKERIQIKNSIKKFIEKGKF